MDDFAESVHDILEPVEEALARILEVPSVEGARKTVAWLFASPAIQHYRYEFRLSSDFSAPPNWSAARLINEIEPPDVNKGEIFANSLPRVWERAGAAGVFVGLRGRSGSTSFLSLAYVADIDQSPPDPHSCAGRLLYLIAAVHDRLYALLTPEQINLSPREVQCLRLFHRGMKIRDIAADLGLKEQTIHFYLDKARAKLNADSSRQAAQRADELGLLMLQ